MIKRARDRASGGYRLTFVIPSDDPPGKVSVVGTFNDWTPGTHELRKRSNGTRSVSVTVPAGEAVTFRYLAENHRWFDDPDADRISDAGSCVEL